MNITHRAGPEIACAIIGLILILAGLYIAWNPETCTGHMSPDTSLRPRPLDN